MFQRCRRGEVLASDKANVGAVAFSRSETARFSPLRPMTHRCEENLLEGPTVDLAVALTFRRFRKERF